MTVTAIVMDNGPSGDMVGGAATATAMIVGTGVAGGIATEMTDTGIVTTGAATTTDGIANIAIGITMGTATKGRVIQHGGTEKQDSL
jgi:hypothetical protein